MKTFEELKGMTHEDLVRHVQELYEEAARNEESRRFWIDRYDALEKRLNTFRDAVKSVVTLVD